MITGTDTYVWLRFVHLVENFMLLDPRDDISADHLEFSPTGVRVHPVVVSLDEQIAVHEEVLQHHLASITFWHRMSFLDKGMY